MVTKRINWPKQILKFLLLERLLKIRSIGNYMNETIIEQLNWRFAAKGFDPARTISDADWATLEDALVLTPSSYGLQPWKFYVITNPELKESLVAASYGQKQVGQCSHLLAITAKSNMEESDVDRLMTDTCETRGVEKESLDFYRGLILKDIVNGPRASDSQAWAKLQCYIALGNIMTCAALMKIDCCPMEGFVPAMYDEALGLDDKGYTTAVVCPFGYRADDDKYATLAKIRYPKEDLIERIT